MLDSWELIEEAGRARSWGRSWGEGRGEEEGVRKTMRSGEQRTTWSQEIKEAEG